MKHFWGLCLLLTGCILPISTGAPMPATTVGKGHIGGAMSGEAPVLDLIADENAGAGSGGDPISYGAAPAAALTFTLSYGLGDNTDLEVAGEGALYYFILPLPTGGSIGLRQHFDAGDALDIAVAARFGHVGSSSSVTDSNGNSTESSASANYGALQLVAQTKQGWVRPLLAINLMPSKIHRAPSEDPAYDFKGFASSVTGGLMLVGAHTVFGPYLAATNFYSDRFDNSGWFVSGGIMFAVRPDRNRPKPPPPPMYAPPPPMMGPPPPSAPPPMLPPAGPPGDQPPGAAVPPNASPTAAPPAPQAPPVPTPTTTPM
ncbi:MAG TPA: hypothetical protein VFV99_05515 [Kofleriaceae bacterium]|nr:hypothetical protein [Kofleriaceae bacterium]